MPRADGPFQVLERINDNAYKIDLPIVYGVLATFNVADFSLYLDDDYLSDLRANSSQQGENDGSPFILASPGQQGSQRSLISSIQAQGIDQNPASSHMGHLELLAHNKPGFVHLIS